MDAIVYEKFGPPEVMVLRSSPLPKVKKDQVLIKVKATSVNPVDYKIRKGTGSPFTKVLLPIIPGGDFSGTIEAVGFNVKEFAVGDEVFGLTPAVRGGAYAEYVAVNKEHLWLKPKNLSFEEAAAIPLTGLTAYQALYNEGEIRSGMRVLINGCTGGVGSFAVQIAKAYDCDVTGICHSKNVEYARELGVDYILPYDERDPLKIKDQYHIFFDIAGKYSYNKIKHLLLKKGRYINLLPSASLFLNALTNKKVKTMWVKPIGKDLENLKAMAEKKLLKPYMDRIYPLQEAVKAHHYCENNSIRGKVVIKV
ncbi:MAG: NAD(P)-dependent alcohol dehydrogenase [Candidatus Cyclobacteriaceae bacterium M2_1C_046]